MIQDTMISETQDLKLAGYSLAEAYGELIFDAGLPADAAPLASVAQLLRGGQNGQSTCARCNERQGR